MLTNFERPGSGLIREEVAMHSLDWKVVEERHNGGSHSIFVFHFACNFGGSSLYFVNIDTMPEGTRSHQWLRSRGLGGVDDPPPQSQ